jgi:putative nucleotidyltransferase with HDIG domain
LYKKQVRKGIANMRRVIALELVGLKKLDCDLYDEGGNIIYEKGNDFTPDLLMRLNHSKVYKRDEEEYSDEKAVATAVIEKDAPPEPKNVLEKAEYKSVLDSKQVETLITNVKEVLGCVEEGRVPDPSYYVNTVKTILKEVYKKCDEVSNIGKLRIQDYYTYTHSINTAVISAIIGRELGFHETKVKELVLSALLHDIGKMQIPKHILYKPGKLTFEEFNLIKNHAVLGYNFIKNEMKLPDYIAKGALEHHERWYGDGYPNNLKGKEISEFGQIIGIADVFDALVSEKIYRGAVQSNDAIRIMLTEESKSFNPDIFHKFAFMAVVKTVRKNSEE